MRLTWSAFFGRSLKTARRVALFAFAATMRARFGQHLLSQYIPSQSLR
jgi:hypothetical protein